MTPGFLANLTSVLEKAGEAATLNTEAEGFSEKLESKCTVLWPVRSQSMVLQQWKLYISESWPHDRGITISTNGCIETQRLKIRSSPWGTRTVNQSVFIKVIQPSRLMGNENYSKSSQTQQMFIPVLNEQHISTWQATIRSNKNIS